MRDHHQQALLRRVATRAGPENLTTRRVNTTRRSVVLAQPDAQRTIQANRRIESQNLTKTRG